MITQEQAICYCSRIFIANFERIQSSNLLLQIFSAEIYCFCSYLESALAYLTFTVAFEYT